MEIDVVLVVCGCGFDDHLWGLACAEYQRIEWRRPFCGPAKIAGLPLRAIV
jgi:hypothetical protein